MQKKEIMIERKLLLGDEAIALGAIHAGISGVYAYPGTPSTEITEYIQANASDVRSRWCTNEKQRWKPLWECLMPENVHWCA